MLTSFKAVFSFTIIAFSLLAAVSQGAPPDEEASGTTEPPVEPPVDPPAEEEDPTLLPQVDLVPCGAAADDVCPDYSTCDESLGACMADMCFGEFVAECPLGYVCNSNVPPPGEDVDPDAGTCEAQTCDAGTACPSGFNCGGDQCVWNP